jgi:predicted transcriptional regulator
MVSLMSATTTCDNPRCSCSPCTGADCRCGVARLGDLERRVMEVLWAEPVRELSSRNVADALPDYAYTTTATVLDRLTDKGLVRRRMNGRVIPFTATDTRAANTAMPMREALASTSDPDAALVRLVESVSHAEAKLLRHALDESARGSRSGRK